MRSRSSRSRGATPTPLGECFDNQSALSDSALDPSFDPAALSPRGSFSPFSLSLSLSFSFSFSLSFAELAAAVRSYWLSRRRAVELVRIMELMNESMSVRDPHH